jgi:hypothetical protein
VRSVPLLTGKTAIPNAGQLIEMLKWNMLELRIATARHINTGHAPLIIAPINVAVLNTAESYPCTNSRRNSHGITSLHKT